MLVVEASAPVRICDAGGWTDTWFAVSGQVCALASAARVHVRVSADDSDSAGSGVLIDAPDLGLRYAVDPDRPQLPLVEAAVAEAGIPDGVALEVRIRSDAPPGSSTGTSAAVVVALLGALDRVEGRARGPADVARAAHCVETDRLGLQSGVQDQLVAAHGGACWIEVGPYPEAVATRLDVPSPTWTELERRVITIYLGQAHASSAVHETVIARLEGEGPSSPALEALRGTARQARDALVSGDVDAYGAALTRNTETQADLHPGLVGTDAHRVIAVAREHGAAGWKVNGAGGEGGSVSVIAPDDAERTSALGPALLALDPSYRLLPAGLSPVGLIVT